MLFSSGSSQIVLGAMLNLFDRNAIAETKSAENSGYVPEEVVKMYYRLNDLYIDITDKIANQGGEV